MYLHTDLYNFNNSLNYYKCTTLSGTSIINHLVMEKAPFFEEEISMIFSLLCFLLVLSIIFTIFYLFSKKKAIQRELEIKDLEIKDLEILHHKTLLEANLLVQEEERQRIGGVLHDEISSQLNLMALDLRLLQKSSLGNNEIKEIYNHLLDVVFKTNESSRKIAHNLFPPLLEKFGLDAALEELIDDFNFSKIITINYANKSNFQVFSSQAQLHIYRIFQELINNSIKHGKSEKIDIKILNVEQKIQFIYVDNGIGFNLQVYKLKSSGLGLKNIENRIFLLNGTFQLKSEPNNGINFQFSIPINKNQQL